MCLGACSCAPGGSWQPGAVLCATGRRKGGTCHVPHQPPRVGKPQPESHTWVSALALGDFWGGWVQCLSGSLVFGWGGFPSSENRSPKSARAACSRNTQRSPPQPECNETACRAEAAGEDPPSGPGRRLRVLSTRQVRAGGSAFQPARPRLSSTMEIQRS